MNRRPHPAHRPRALLLSRLRSVEVALPSGQPEYVRAAAYAYSQFNHDVRGSVRRGDYTARVEAAFTAVERRGDVLRRLTEVERRSAVQILSRLNREMGCLR